MSHSIGGSPQPLQAIARIVEPGAPQPWQHVEPAADSQGENRGRGIFVTGVAGGGAMLSLTTRSWLHAMFVDVEQFLGHS